LETILNISNTSMEWSIETGGNPIYLLSTTWLVAPWPKTIIDPVEFTNGHHSPFEIVTGTSYAYWTIYGDPHRVDCSLLKRCKPGERGCDDGDRDKNDNNSRGIQTNGKSVRCGRQTFERSQSTRFQSVAHRECSRVFAATEISTSSRLCVRVCVWVFFRLNFFTRRI